MTKDEKDVCKQKASQLRKSATDAQPKPAKKKNAPVFSPFESLCQDMYPKTYNISLQQ